MAKRTPSVDEVFTALADPSRRTILERLAQGEATVGEVAAPLRMAAPSVSRHVKVLERASLVSRRVEGRQHWLRLDPAGFRNVIGYLLGYERFWEGSLDRLEGLVKAIEEGDGR